MDLQQSIAQHQPGQQENLFDDPIWYSLPYDVTTLLKAFGNILVLPTTSD